MKKKFLKERKKILRRMVRSFLAQPLAPSFTEREREREKECGEQIQPRQQLQIRQKKCGIFFKKKQCITCSTLGQQP